MRALPPSTPRIARMTALAAVAPLLLVACATGGEAREEGGTVDIGYGEVAEDHVDGSVETIEPEDERLKRTRTLADMLARVPGVQVTIVGDNLRVRIRGGSSLLASEEPLVVVDGMEYRGGLRGLDPSTIDSIRVLKNASETAVYGARGANGVILITTQSAQTSGV